MAPVKLYVWSLNGGDHDVLRVINALNYELYMSAVVVFGKVHLFSMEGIEVDDKGRGSGATRIERMGETKRKKLELERYIESIAYKYTKDTFHLMHCNSNHFSRDILGFLVNKDLPRFLADSVRAVERGFWAHVACCLFWCSKRCLSDNDIKDCNDDDDSE